MSLPKPVKPARQGPVQLDLDGLPPPQPLEPAQPDATNAQPDATNAQPDATNAQPDATNAPFHPHETVGVLTPENIGLIAAALSLPPAILVDALIAARALTKDDRARLPF